MSRLPEGWKEIKISDLSTVVGGGTPSTSKLEYFEGTIPWITPADLSGYDSMYISGGKRFLTEAALASCSAKLLPKDSVIFSTRAPIGYVAIAQVPLATNQGFKSILPSESYDSKYAYYYFKSIKEYAESEASGTTFKELSGKKFGELRFPLAPLPEQKRIVAKLDKLFAHLDQLKARLERIPELLKQFRQAVLTQAVTGKLTEEWRLHYDGNLSGDPVLEGAILKRRDNWIKRSLADFEVSGKKPKNELWKEKYVIPFELESRLYHDLPPEWASGTWDQITDWVTYGFTRPMPHFEEGVPIITGKNVLNGYIDFDNIVCTDPISYSELSDKDKPVSGDILITKDGTIGRAAVVETDKDFCINQSVAVAWMRGYSLNRKFLLYVILSETTQKEIKLKSKGVAVQHLSVTDFRKMHVPIPSIAEQNEIVRRVEWLFLSTGRIEASYKALSEKVDRLPQAFLSKAFRGELASAEKVVAGYLEEVGKLGIAAEP